MAHYYIFVFLMFFEINPSHAEITKCIDTELIDVHNNIVNKESCITRPPCIISTCPYGEFNTNRSCSQDCACIKDPSLDFSKFLKLYKIVNNEPVESDSLLDNIFQVVTFKKQFAQQYNKKCLSRYYTIGEDFDGYLLQNGSYLINLGGTFKIIPASEYILRFTVSKNSSNGVRKPELRLKFVIDDEQQSLTKSPLMKQVYAYVMFVSCAFMILVVVVYVLCKELRTTAGLIFMTYVTNLAITFFLSAAQSLGVIHDLFDGTTCYVLSALRHFFLFSSFTWMNIMGFDIWWTLRKLVFQRPVKQAKNYGKYALYCCLAWLPSLLYVIIEVCLDEFTSTYGPKFRYCTANANIWYWTAPTLVLQLVNFLPLVLTIFNLWRFKQSLKQLDNADSSCSSPRQNAFLSVKIFIAMGTNWFLDVMLLVFDGALPAWFGYITNMLNALNGVILFFVFVFKADVLLKLFRRLSINNGITRYLERRVSGKFDRKKSRKCMRHNSSATVTQTVSNSEAGLSESE